MEHVEQIKKVFKIFSASDAEIRPHFFLLGPSGSSKTFTIKQLADELELQYTEINAAQLTKEGTSGNSLSKALAPLGQLEVKPTVCLVDEFDKLFVSGNLNSDLAHETTNGVQNEFLKVLESDTTSVYGDYAKYVDIPVSHVLFVFAGAFNGEEGIDLERLKQLGVKTEFLGRVGLVYNTNKVSLATLISAMKESKLLDMYLQLFPKVKRSEVEDILSQALTETYESNNLGYRVITTLIHQYFIEGGINIKKEKEKVFKKSLEL